MCRLVETVKMTLGIARNLDRHNARLNRTRRELFHSTDEIDLAARLSLPALYASERIIKCRVLYGEVVERIEFQPYRPRTIRSLRLVYSDTIEYAHKFEERSGLDKLFLLRGGCDDILIVKLGKITDTSFSNIAFFNGCQWVTPAKPLLEGTQRARLIAEGTVREGDITPSDLKLFAKAVLINSMLEFEDNVLVDIEKIS